MKSFKIIPYILLFLALSGCQSNQYAQQISIPKLPNSIYLDGKFNKPFEIETPKQIFYVSKQMKNYVKTRLNPLDGTTLKTRRLIEDLFSENELNVGYLHNANYTASETFEHQQANCLSLTILSYVLVKEAGLSASFIDVKVAENWNQVNGTSMLNGHVNLKVTERYNHVFHDFMDTTITIDFVPLMNIPTLTKTELNKDEIIALFYNNKGGEALASKQFDIAYQYLSAATRYAPYRSSIWGNLASLYRQSGYLAEAELIYDYALQLDPTNLNVKENIARLYNLTERSDIANTLLQAVDNERQSNPYYHAMLGDEKFYDNDYLAAINHYKKAIRKNKHEHTFYFGLAKSYMMMNDLENADKYLEKAKSLSSEIKQVKKYQSKISALNNLMAKVH